MEKMSAIKIDISLELECSFKVIQAFSGLIKVKVLSRVKA